jgi:response regulator of citrate/malate metabolism
LLQEKGELTVRGLAEETLTNIVARLETYQQKPLRRLPKETVVAKSSVQEATKFLVWKHNM